MSKLGLVLSGGGSKGAYQIGVYKALLKLGKKPNIVTGTSVGALNGVLIIQNDIRRAIKMWRNISFLTIYDENSFPNTDNEAIANVYKQYVKTFINEGGMDISKLSSIFDKLYNPNKFFRSEVDYGLVTYNLSKNKPVLKTKRNLEANKVKDYVISSASCYPAFKPYKIDNELYIDGGYHDNLPINLAVNLGADEIIAVDLRAVGFKKDTKEDVNITVISPRNKIVSFLVFEKTKSREAIRFGYNDTMKTFGKLDGDVFTFKKNNLVKNYNKYNEEFEKNLNSVFEGLDSAVLNKIVSSSVFKSIISDKVSYKNFNDLVEKAGICFAIPEDNIYNIKSFNRGLLNGLSAAIPTTKGVIGDKIKNKDFNKLIDKKQVVKFFYEAIIKNNFEQAIKFIPLFIEEFLIAMYIYTIKGRRRTY